MTSEPTVTAPVPPEPVLVVDDVGHLLGGSSRVLQDVSVQLAAGEVLALVGRSGSGKTTLCHLVAGLGRPTSGRILVAGADAHDVDDWAVVSLLPQRLGLVEELTVEQNVLLPSRLRGSAGSVDEDLVADLFASLDLTAFRDRRATQTSLGEQQRTALARALVLRPRLAVLDEPTGHQDDEHVALIGAALEVARRHGVAVLAATHDERIIGSADRVVTLAAGRVVPDGSR